MNKIEQFNIVWVSLTYECNNHCGWCYTASNLSERKLLFPEEMERETLDLILSLGVKKVILIGGEPTTHPDLPRVVREISEREVVVGLISNGRKLRDCSFVEELFDSGLTYATISVCGSNQETHDSVTGVPGSFYQTLEGIRQSCSEGLKVATNTVIAKNNINNLEEIVDLFVDGQVREMTFNVCGVCVSEESNNSQLIHPYDGVKAFERVYLYAKEKGVRAKLVTPMPLCFFSDDLREELKSQKRISGGPCQLVYGKNFAIEPTGDIIACTHLAHFPLLNIFNNGSVISKEEFLAKYNNPSGVPYQFRQKMSRYPSTKCDDDLCLESCSGGCPLYWTQFNPEKEILGIRNA